MSPDETEFLSNFNGTVPGSGLTNLINATVYFSNSENSINDNNVTSELPSPTVDAAEEQQQEDVMNCCIKTASQLPQWLWENGQVPDYFIKSVNYIADGEGGNSCQISYAHPYVRVQLHPAVLWQLASSTTLNIQQITPQANTQQQQQQQSQPQRDRNLQNSRELLGHVTSAPKSRPSSAAVNVGDDGKQQLGSQMFVRKSTVAVAEQEQTQAVSNSQSQSSLPGGEGQVTTGNKQVGDKSGEESAQDAAATGASQGKFSLALKALALEGL